MAAPPHLTLEEHDIELAGARLLGRDIAKCSGAGLRANVMKILVEETAEIDHNRLAVAMTFTFDGTEFQQNLLFLKKIKIGIVDCS